MNSSIKKERNVCRACPVMAVPCAFLYKIESSSRTMYYILLCMCSLKEWRIHDTRTMRRRKTTTPDIYIQLLQTGTRQDSSKSVILFLACVLLFLILKDLEPSMSHKTWLISLRKFCKKVLDKEGLWDGAMTCKMFLRFLVLQAEYLRLD